MIIYLESSLKNNKQAQQIVSTYAQAEVLEINNYKNIFDKKISGTPQKSIVLASVKQSISKAPPLYGHPGGAYFFKNSLNCIYDCSYCYLKGSFKNEQNVFFLNYDHIKSQISATIDESKHDINRFYSSDYSDNLATDAMTNFCEEFIPFFAKLKSAKMEIRTKSENIASILKLSPTQNVEIAFSLNPTEIIKKHEKGTTKLEKRIRSINTLVDAGWQVGIRFMPLIEFEDFEKVYSEFIDDLVDKIDFSKIYSVFIGGLLYTHEDYNAILKKQPYLSILHKLEKGSDGYFRENVDIRACFYKLFQSKLKKINCNICLDSLH